jgi:hypothetical protein
MSDYLGNLVTRTLSVAAAVQPQLPSLFEPSVASGQIKSELEFEQETFSAGPLITQRAEPTAWNPSSILTPRQSSLGEPEPPPITHLAVRPVPAPPSNLAPHQSALGDPESERIAHRTGTPGSNLPPHESAVRGPEPITPQASRPKGIPHATKDSQLSPESVVPQRMSRRPVQVEPSVGPIRLELRKNDSRAGQRESSSRRARASEAPTLVSQLSAPDSQPKSPSLVRPAATVQKIRATEAVVPAIRSLPQFPPAPKPASAPTINVTIGRVEIRATSPAPPPQRARSKSANVLSLEDYLRQRASGGSR